MGNVCIIDRTDTGVVDKGEARIASLAHILPVTPNTVCHLTNVKEGHLGRPTNCDQTSVFGHEENG